MGNHELTEMAKLTT